MSNSYTALELRELVKSYGSREILRGVSGTFQRGKVTALVGSNGAGKTTLLRIAAGLQQANSGSVVGGGVMYYGGFDQLPVNGTINALRSSFGLPEFAASGQRKLSKLSRGELHRVGLDVALELAPDVLLLDEPWTALEPDAREDLNRELRRAAVGHAIVCSTHDLDEVTRVADDVVVLANGIGKWVRREDVSTPFDRDELMRLYRESRRAL